MVLVGDRRMLTQQQMEKINEHSGWAWTTALTIGQERSVAAVFLDEKNLAEVATPDDPGERLIACYDPLLKEERGRKLQDLLEASEKGFTKSPGK